MALKEYFTPGNIVPSYFGHDKVIAFHPATNADGTYWSVDVVAVENKDGKWTPIKGERIRNHATSPSGADLARGPVQRVNDNSTESQQTELKPKKGLENAKEKKKNWLDGETVTDKGSNTDDIKLLVKNWNDTQPSKLSPSSVRQLSVHGQNAELLSKIAGFFNLKTVFFETQDSSLAPHYGLYFAKDKRIYLNISSQQPHLQTIGHELLHSMVS